jgi:hypothetical protein
MNSELLALYEADRREHASGFGHGAREYVEMRERDRQRRLRVAEIMAEDASNGPEDLYYAAWIFNHGDTPEEAWQGHTFANQAAARGHGPARWLAAATYDRWLMYQGKPQKYGTQYVTDGRRHRLWDAEPTTTDAERAAWDVPPLAEQLRKAEHATRVEPPGPVGEDAPQWLQEAIKRWRTEEAA